MQELSNLQDKLERLLARYYALKSHANELEKNIAQQKEEIRKLLAKNEILQDDLQKTKMDSFLKGMPEEEKGQLKEQIDSVLKMIETNIKLLK